MEGIDDPGDGVNYSVDSGALVSLLVKVAKICASTDNAEHFTNAIANLKINRGTGKRGLEEELVDEGKGRKKRKTVDKNEKQKWFCGQCNVSFLHEAALDKHVLTHSKGKTRRTRLVVASHDWECQVCGKYYSSQNNLNRHVKEVHEGEKRGKESTKADGKSVKHKCTLCDKELVQIYKHYKEKHDIEYPEQILFNSGNVLVNSDIDTDHGKAPWFIEEKKKAEKRYTRTTCKLCLNEVDFQNDATLEDHYTLLHMVDPDFLRNIDGMFRAEKNAHLDKTPSQKTRTDTPKRRPSAAGGGSRDKIDKKPVSKANDKLGAKNVESKSDIGPEFRGGSSLIIYLCKCGVATTSYDASVEHSQRHLALPYAPLSAMCDICHYRFEAPCFEEHKARDCGDEVNKTINYDYDKLTSDTWFQMFENISNKHALKIIDSTLYKYCRSVKLNCDMKSGEPLYRCAVCQLFVDPTEVEDHCKESSCSAKNSVGYSCSECDRAFYTSKALANHKENHATGAYRIVTFNRKNDAKFNKALEKTKLSSTEGDQEQTEQEDQEQEIVETPKRPQSKQNFKITGVKCYCQICQQWIPDFEYNAHKALHNSSGNLGADNGESDTGKGKQQDAESVVNEMDTSVGQSVQDPVEKSTSNTDQRMDATMNQMEGISEEADKSDDVEKMDAAANVIEQNDSGLSKRDDTHRMDMDVEVTVEPWSDESCDVPSHSTIVVEAQINASVKYSEEMNPQTNADVSMHSPESVLGEMCGVNGSQSQALEDAPTQSTQDLLEVLGDADMDTNNNNESEKQQENRAISPDIFTGEERTQEVNNPSQVSEPIIDTNFTETKSHGRENHSEVPEGNTDRREVTAQLSSRDVLDMICQENNSGNNDLPNRKHFETWLKEISKKLFKNI